MKFADKIHGFEDKAKEEFLGRAELEIIHKLINERDPKTHMLDFLAAYELAHGKDGMEKATELTLLVEKTLEKIRLEAAGDEKQIYDLHVMARALQPLEQKFRIANNDIQNSSVQIPPELKLRAADFFEQLDTAIQDFIAKSGTSLNFNPE